MRKSQPAKVTRKDIAEGAGVSTSTVGMILSGQGERYNKETRERVHATAKKLGYRPSINARALRLNRSLLIGVLFHEVNSSLAAPFLQGIQQAISATDYSPLVFFSKVSSDQDLCLKRCLDRQIDALVINCAVDPAASEDLKFARRVAKLPIPVIEVFGHFLPNTPKVNIGNVQSGFLCAQHLIGQGHRRIVLVTHSRYENQDLHFDAWEQAQGYRQCMANAGLSPTIVTGDLDFLNVTDTGFLQSGYDAFAKLQALPDPPTAVVCYNDFMAYGINRACRDRGLKVPGDLSIVGNNNATLSQIVNPALTSTIPRYFEIGSLAASKVIDAINGETITDALIPPDLIVRKSTGPAN